MEDPTECEKLKCLQTLKNKLHEIEKKLVSLVKTFNWDYSKLLEDDSNMVTCSINNQHRVSKGKIELHKEYCFLRSQGYNESDKILPEYSGSGSCVSLTSQMIDTITKNVSSKIENETLRSVPQTSANFDQNFSREEKLAIYDYIIANTQKQKTFSDLCGQVSEKKEEKKEMSVWEIAAAERDAKRRRASYRNKVHTSCKTHTQILREVIEGQMQMLKEECMNEKLNEESKKPKTKELEKDWKKSDLQSYQPSEKRKFHKMSNFEKAEGDSKRKHSSHDRGKNYYSQRSPRDSRGDYGSRSRSCDKYRKWKTSEGRSHLYKSSR